MLAIPSNEEAQQPIASRARTITVTKNSNPKQDTSVLEREIDQQVYALYGLSPEEIDLVEGAVK